MSKKGNQSNENECPICGGVIWGKGQKVLLEGAKMNVCQSCAQYGSKVSPKPKPSYQKRPAIAPKQKVVKAPYPKANEPRDELELVPDYAKRIRLVREKHNLNQDQFAQKIHEKVSLIKRIEAGKAKPTIELAKKIEETYKIKLLEETIEEAVNINQYIRKDRGTSLGDIAFIKKKK